MTTFIDFLSQKKLIPAQALEHITLEQNLSSSKTLTDIILSRTSLSKDQLRAYLCEHTNIPNLSSKRMLERAAAASPHLAPEKAKTWQCILLNTNETYAEVALVDFENLPLCDEIAVFLGKPIRRYILLSSDFGELYEAIYGHAKKSPLMDHGLATLNHLIEEGIRAHASDVHVQPGKEFVAIKHRVDGILNEQDKLSLQAFEKLLATLKVQAHMDVGESRKPQHGRYLFPFAGRDVDLRIACHPTIYGENIVIRILDKRVGLKKLNELGFSEVMYTDLKKLSNMPAGMIIFTGPTGSGKTTTLYALLREMDQRKLNIMTLEDPVEYHIEGIRQTEVSRNLTYADGVRSLLRQDPDVILIGEIRDEETAAMALRASMTGHLVLTTLHTGDAFTVPCRLRDLGISNEQMSAHTLAFVSQRLIRTYCDSCQGKGCKICDHSGYKGRTCIGEYLLMDDKVRESLSANHPAHILKKLAQQNLFRDAQDKVNSQITSEDEITRVLGAVSL